MSVYLYLDGLPGQWINGSSCPHLELVENHVAQPLVVDDTKIDVGSEFLSSDARVHRFISIVVVS